MIGSTSRGLNTSPFSSIQSDLAAAAETAPSPQQLSVSHQPSKPKTPDAAAADELIDEDRFAKFVKPKLCFLTFPHSFSSNNSSSSSYINSSSSYINSSSVCVKLSDVSECKENADGDANLPLYRSSSASSASSFCWSENNVESPLNNSSQHDDNINDDYRDIHSRCESSSVDEEQNRISTENLSKDDNSEFNKTIAKDRWTEEELETLAKVIQ